MPIPTFETSGANSARWGQGTHSLLDLLPLLLRQLVLLLPLQCLLLQPFPLALQTGVLALLLGGGCAEGWGHGTVGEFA